MEAYIIKLRRTETKWKPRVRLSFYFISVAMYAPVIILYSDDFMIFLRLID